MGMEIITAGI